MISNSPTVTLAGVEAIGKIERPVITSYAWAPYKAGAHCTATVYANSDASDPLDRWEVYSSDVDDFSTAKLLVSGTNVYERGGTPPVWDLSPPGSGLWACVSKPDNRTPTFVWLRYISKNGVISEWSESKESGSGGRVNTVC